MSPRPFEPGTTGWTSLDLDDPAIEREWEQGRYEIIEGVLTTMPAAYFAAGNAIVNLLFAINSYLRERRLPGRFATAVEIIIDELRVVRADAALLLPADDAKQQSAAEAASRPDPRRTRILVPPTLVIESVSPGHELHDSRTKRNWYAEFGVPHYWLLNAFERSLRCLVLDGGQYREEAAGRNEDELHPALSPGLTIPLKDVWRD